MQAATQRQLHPNLALGSEYPVGVVVELDRQGFEAVAAECRKRSYILEPFTNLEAQIEALNVERRRLYEETGKIEADDDPNLNAVMALHAQQDEVLFRHTVQSLLFGNENVITGGFRMPITLFRVWVSHNRDRLGPTFGGGLGYALNSQFEAPEIKPDELAQVEKWSALLYHLLELDYTGKIVGHYRLGGETYAIFRFEVWLRRMIMGDHPAEQAILRQKKPLHVFHQGLAVTGSVYLDEEPEKDQSSIPPGICPHCKQKTWQYYGPSDHSDSCSCGAHCTNPNCPASKSK